MNLQEMDLLKLATLWSAAGGNPSLKEALELELKNRIAENKNFSREFIFKICKIDNHAITISFIPGSDSFHLYGSQITIDLLISDEELAELFKNYTNRPPIDTYGQLRGKSLISKQLTETQIKQLATIGFNTSEIIETAHV